MQPEEKVWEIDPGNDGSKGVEEMFPGMRPDGREKERTVREMSEEEGHEG